MSTISRRTLAKGTAWAVPAVAVASVAPSVAASPIVTVSEAGKACKLPGNSCGGQGYNKGYLQPLEICNNSNTATITVTITEPAYLLINGKRVQFHPNPKTFTVDPGDCQRVILNLNLQDNSTNSSIKGTIKWTYESTDGQSGEGTTDIYTAATPPCINCSV